MGIKNIASNIFYIFHHLSRCEAPQYKWMETLLQGRKADATNRSVGFSDSLNGIENYGVIFKNPKAPLIRSESESEKLSEETESF